MRDQDVPLHRVRGLVSGANWRATKFATPVPPLFACELCGVISPTTFLLPCLHTLCESCASQSANDGNAACPFDAQSFSVGDCPKFSLPPGTADKLEACCWNESQGCTFIGTLQAVLTHYEEHCVFHVVSCPRCNGSVLLQDLPRHYRAGCHGEAISSSPELPTLVQGLVLRPEGDTETSLDELIALPRDPYQEKLPEIQRKLDEVLEETKNIGTQLEELTKTSRGREDRLTRALEELSTTFSQELQSQLHELPACATDMSNLGRNTNGEAGTTSANDMPWSLEKKHVLRKLELLATDSQAYLEFLRQRSGQHLHQPAAEYEPFIPTPGGDIKVLMSPFTGKLESQGHSHVVSVTHVDSLFKSKRVVGLLTRWYRRDKYFQMAAQGIGGECLHFYLKFGETLKDTCSTSPEIRLSLRHPDYPEKKDFPLVKSNHVESSASALGFQDEFVVFITDLKSSRFVKDGRLMVVVAV
ncbi:uncharacterized protein LOC144149205 [Haemaphysalis longicornis]